MYSGLAVSTLLQARLLYLGRPKLLQLLLVFLADLLKGLQSGVRFGFIELGHGEAHVDEHPIPNLYPLLIIMNQADVYVPPNSPYLRLGQVDILVQDLDYLAWYPQTHVPYSSLSSQTPLASTAWPNESPPSLAGTLRCR